MDLAYSPPRGAGGASRGLCAAVAVLVVLLLAYFFFVRPRYFAKPDCSRLKGTAAAACRQMSAACAGDAACLNALARCAPLAAGPPSPCKTRACVDAVTRVEPGAWARLLNRASPLACVPQGQPLDANRAAAQARALAPLAAYSMQVLGSLPPCPAGVSMPVWRAALQGALPPALLQSLPAPPAGAPSAP
jgi:hypothetical protein